MDLQLCRRSYMPDGIFSQLKQFDGQLLCATLEHAYDDGDGYFVPKIPGGVYTCKRGIHALHNGIPFETFEITGVEGHVNLLFHAGNFNKDSEGCVLLGEHQVQSNGVDMVTNSRTTFQQFMQLQFGVEEFRLEVIE